MSKTLQPAASTSLGNGYAMLIDATRCIDCKGCLTSCKVAHQVPPGQSRNWIKVKDSPRQGRGPGGTRQTVFQPGGCMHCRTAPCLDACPTGATYRDDEGVVQVDRARCIGCGLCVKACPYDARFIHATLHVADKCDFCTSRRAQGLQPACVDTCPTHARIFGPVEEVLNAWQQRLAAEGAKPLEGLEMVRPVNLETQPVLAYVNGTSQADWPRKAEQPAAMNVLAGAGKAVYGLGLLSLGAVCIMGINALRERGQEKRETEDQQGERHD